MKQFKDWRYMAAIFIVLPLLLIGAKLYYFDYNLQDLLPEKGYKLNLTIETQNEKPANIRVRVYVPVNNAKQSVMQEQGVSDNFAFNLTSEENNRLVTWQSGKISGSNKMQYDVTLKSSPIRYVFTPETQIQKINPAQYRKYLQAEENIQVDSALVRAKMEELTRDQDSLHDKIRAIHDFIQNDIAYINFAGALDAESCLQLKEGSCNGKSRLYVAMVRQMGVPARLVGGIVLNSSPKKTIHQWLEIYINGQWVPFCPTNNHFAELPQNYIVLYYGDNVLFRRTAGIFFDYSYSYEMVNLPKDDLNQTFHDLPVNIFSVMDKFEKFNLSLNVFIYLLMLPLAAVVSVILKNIIGLETFGTFLPILIASVLDSTGVWVGLLVFFSVIFLVYGVNRVIARLDLLYHPRMAILLSLVILALLSVFNLGLALDNYHLVYVVYFPVAILAITINRVIAMLDEQNFRRLLQVSVNTVIVTLTAYYFINSTILQLLMMSFPELILLLVGVNILIGRWAGFRLTEYYRFAGFFKGSHKNVEINAER